MAEGLIELEIPARPEYLALVRSVVAAAAALEGSLADRRIEDLRLAASEATTNAIEAHTDLDDEERIFIRCNLAGDRIEIEVSDRGEGFDPEMLVELPEADEPERLHHNRGLGLPLMRVLTDETQIRSTDDGTDVRLVVYTTQRRDASGDGSVAT